MELKIQSPIKSELISPGTIEVIDLQKSFRNRHVLLGVNLKLAPGCITGLVGKNGAGKTTILNILAGFLRPGSGTVQFAPSGSSKHTQCAPLFLPDLPAFSAKTTAFECIRLACDLARKTCDDSEISLALHRVGIADHAQAWATTLSMGMQKRLQWAHAIALQPSVLLLDEPSAFLDPSGVVALRNFLAAQRHDGCAIMMSSHNMHEVLLLAQTIYFLAEGVVTEVPVNSLLKVEELEGRFFYDRGTQIG